MDVAGANTADGTQIQLLHLQQHLGAVVDPHGQTIRALGKCLDVSGGGTANGTKVQLWTCNGTGAQNWVVGVGRRRAQPAVRTGASRRRAARPPTARRCGSGTATPAPTNAGRSRETWGGIR